MLLRLTVLFAGHVLIAACSGPDASSTGAETGADNTAVDELFVAWDRPGSPGCALAVAQDGKLLYSRGYGYANLDYGLPITPQTAFDVASVTKQFTAASLSMLALEGKLSLDDSVRTWLPELPEYAAAITLRHMLGHTSGLRDYLNLFPLAGRDDYHPVSHERILEMMARQHSLVFPPGEQYLYSNTAYMLLAQVIERAGGQSLGEIADARIFEPLGMQGSRMYDDREEIIPLRATGYDRDADGSVRIVHNYNFDVVGDGQLYSTVEDLLRWDEYLHGADKPPIHPMMLAEGRLANGEPTGYALGIRLAEYRGLRTVGHSGSSWGFRTELVRFLEPGLSIAIACNSDSADPGALAEKVADHYLAAELQPASESDAARVNESGADDDSSPSIEQTNGQLSEYAGTFYSPELDAGWRFSIVDERLTVRIGQERPLLVQPLDEVRFRVDFRGQGLQGRQPADLEFFRNGTDVVIGFVLSSGSERGIVFERRPAAGTIIINARVIDGSGGPSRSVDVRIAGDRIAAIGSLERAAADRVVDANGLVLAPGFIDVHSHHDDGLLERPGALAAVNQGITSIVAGQDGSQQYPLHEFFAQLERTPAAINVASFAGHGTLRSQVMGRDYRRNATEEEVSSMVRLLRAEMEAGALGLSTGLEYDPGSFSSYEELLVLARAAASHGGRYVSHVRSEDRDFWEAIDEAINIGRDSRIPVQVSHIKLAMTRWWDQADRLKSMLDAARRSGVDISADIYPYRAWNTNFSWLVTLFPDRDLERQDGAAYILNDMLSPDGIVLATYVPEPAYNGLSIAEIARLRESDAATTLVELLKAELAAGDGTAASQMLGFAMAEADIESIMAWSHSTIGSDGELAGVHPRGFGAFARYLGHYVRDREVLSLEEGIRRISSLAARQVGITGRGSIRTGHYADLVLFDPAVISDRATPARPHAPSVGIVKVWVNGRLVFDDGQVTGNRPGRVLRRAGN